MNGRGQLGTNQVAWPESGFASKGNRGEGRRCQVAPPRAREIRPLGPGGSAWRCTAGGGRESSEIDETGHGPEFR